VKHSLIRPSLTKQNTELNTIHITQEHPMSEVFIPIFFFLVVGGTIAVAILTKHRERLTMLDKGLSPQDIKALYERSTSRPQNVASALKWGIVFISVGLAVLLGMWLREQFRIDEVVYFGLISLFGGIGLVIYYGVARKQEPKTN
jgi:Domain of unknown function (DUF6249)